MRRKSYFRSQLRDHWPTSAELSDYFLSPSGHRFFDGENDTAGLYAEGAAQTAHLEKGQGRLDIHLSLCGHSDFGVLLFYTKWDGREGGAYGSVGDLDRLGEWVETLHEDLRPVGLFIPCEQAWKAVKEFVDSDGELPKCIEWIAASELPPEAFPEPGSVPNDHPNIHR